MKLVKTIFVLLGLALLIGVLVSPASADQWNKKTVMTFNQPIQIPGKALPAGTYVFKLLDSASYRHIVQVWNADETTLIATILAIPNYRLEPTADSTTTFYERPANVPMALRAWFYPGDNFGQEFVYPKPKASEIAEATNEVVPAEETLPTESTLKTVPLFAVTPEKKEEPVTKAFQIFPTPAPTEQATAPVKQAEPAKLPQTGSSIPLFGLLGFAAIALGLALKMLAKLIS